MRLSTVARAKRELIEQAFLVSRDDQGIADHFHVPMYEILALRTTFEEELAEKEEAARTAEEWGSTRLKDEIQLLFRRWERRHGFQNGAAEVLLPAGYAA